MKKNRLNDLESVYNTFALAKTTTNMLKINKPNKVLVIRFCLIAYNKSPINTLNGKDNIINMDVLLDPPANKLNNEKNILHNNMPRTFCFFTVLPIPVSNKYIIDTKNNTNRNASKA